MPTYDYHCKSCEEEFEIFHSITAERLTRCPSCELDTLERRIGVGAGIIFKGSGFYQTDYKNSSDKKSESAHKEVKKKESGATESKAATSGSSESKSKSKNETSSSGVGAKS